MCGPVSGSVKKVTRTLRMGTALLFPCVWIECEEIYSEITNLVRGTYCEGERCPQCPTALDKTFLLLVTVPYAPFSEAKCSAWKHSSFGDSLFQIQGFKLTYDHVST